VLCLFAKAFAARVAAVVMLEDFFIMGTDGLRSTEATLALAS
jgi:hypothetical protein